MIWRKHLWGVEFRGTEKDSRPMLLGATWHDVARTRGGYHGEPTRALLFTSRDAARAWCRAQINMFKDRTDCCAEWRYRPVPVIETVKRRAVDRCSPLQSTNKEKS